LSREPIKVNRYFVFFAIEFARGELYNFCRRA
jgi:hypothetical protein